MNQPPSESEQKLYQFFMAMMDKIAKAVVSNDLHSSSVTSKTSISFTNRICSCVTSLWILRNNHHLHPGWDMAVLLRSLFDACVQCLYFLQDPAIRGQDYLDFRHIERKRAYDDISKIDGPIVRMLLASPHRSQGETELKDNYNRVAHRFMGKKGHPSDNWYRKTLADISKQVGVENDYKLFVRYLSSVVHASARGYMSGPMEPNLAVFAALSCGAKVLIEIARTLKIHLDPDEQRNLALLSECKLH
jgi:hypothetical protein